MSVPDKKLRILDLVRQGNTIDQSCSILGISPKSYEYYRKTDESFRLDMDFLREQLRRPSAQTRVPLPEFAEFSEKYLGARVFWHQQQWIDVIEGKTLIPATYDPNSPKFLFERGRLHSSQRYEPGWSDQHLIINTPPGHAKSTTITMNYVVWRIIQDPEIQILIVSSNATQANKFLFGIKQRLDSTASFADLRRDFAPLDGFDGGNAIWRNDMIYVNRAGDDTSMGEKDATVQAIGMGKRIYGTRSDLIILDDVVDNTNAHDYDKQIEWIQNILQSRIDGGDGKILVVGTRLATQDLYGELMKDSYYSGEEPPWTYLSQCALMEENEDPAKWVTLWPRSNVRPRGQSYKELLPDADGLFPKWDHITLNRKRRGTSPRNWSMVYQQQQVASDAIFAMEDVNGCTTSRKVGRMQPGPHRIHGMLGLHVIAGLDPAAAGHTAAVVMGVDRQTQMRYVLDVWNQSSMNYAGIINMIKEWTVRYGVMEWRVEKNNVQDWIVQDEPLQDFLRGRGVQISPHFTSGNKWDEDFGVASMADLFRGSDTGRHHVELPSPKSSQGVQALREQLVSWFPATKGKTDCVMAFWFAEIRARQIVTESDTASHWDYGSKLRSERDKAMQGAIELDMYAAREFYDREA